MSVIPELKNINWDRCPSLGPITAARGMRYGVGVRKGYCPSNPNQKKTWNEGGINSLKESEDVGGTGGNGCWGGSHKCLPQAAVLWQPPCWLLRMASWIKPNLCLRKLVAWWGHSLWLMEFSSVPHSGVEKTYPPFMRYLLGIWRHLAYLFKIFPRLNIPG